MTADICVAVPTIRNPDCVRAYVANARSHGFDLDRLVFVLVTEDHCDVAGMEAMLDDLGVEGRVFDGTRREAWFADRGLGEYADLVPARSHAQTSFGLLYLWANDFEYGVFVDDDTAPLDEYDFFGRHLDVLGHEGEVEEAGSDEGWVNVLYQRRDGDAELYPRGYPYGAMDADVETTTAEVDRVVASQGLWTNVPDLDAVRILMDGDLRGQARTRTAAGDFEREFAVAPGQYLTVCSMNLAFRREVVPAFYQLPMDDNPWDVGRFDDIWSGVFLKRAADLAGDSVLSGFPLCRHDKAPRSTFSDLANEAPGLELNEHLADVVTAATPEPPADLAAREAAGESVEVIAAEEGARAAQYAAAFEVLTDALATGEFGEYANGGFLNYCGEHMREWLDCLAALSADRPARQVANRQV